MARELKALDISHAPELQRLVDEVQRSGEPRLLRREGQDVAIVLPVRPATTGRVAALRDAFRDLESLRGAAGTLKQSLAWDEMLEIAREDHLRGSSPDAE